jgi:hypothetical protein
MLEPYETLQTMKCIAIYMPGLGKISFVDEECTECMLITTFLLLR